jgi:hypothetical protein
VEFVTVFVEKGRFGPVAERAIPPFFGKGFNGTVAKFGPAADFANFRLFGEEFDRGALKADPARSLANFSVFGEKLDRGALKAGTARSLANSTVFGKEFNRAPFLSNPAAGCGVLQVPKMLNCNLADSALSTSVIHRGFGGGALVRHCGPRQI